MKHLKSIFSVITFSILEHVYALNVLNDEIPFQINPGIDQEHRQGTSTICFDEEFDTEQYEDRVRVIYVGDGPFAISEASFEGTEIPETPNCDSFVQLYKGGDSSKFQNRICGTVSKENFPPISLDQFGNTITYMVRTIGKVKVKACVKLLSNSNQVQSIGSSLKEVPEQPFMVLNTEILDVDGFSYCGSHTTAPGSSDEMKEITLQTTDTGKMQISVMYIHLPPNEDGSCTNYIQIFEGGMDRNMQHVKTFCGTGRSEAITLSKPTLTIHTHIKNANFFMQAKYCASFTRSLDIPGFAQTNTLHSIAFATMTYFLINLL